MGLANATLKYQATPSQFIKFNPTKEIINTTSGQKHLQRKTSDREDRFKNK